MTGIHRLEKIQQSGIKAARLLVITLRHLRNNGSRLRNGGGCGEGGAKRRHRGPCRDTGRCGNYAPQEDFTVALG